MIEWLHIILPETEVAAVALLILICQIFPTIQYVYVCVCTCVYVSVCKCLYLYVRMLNFCKIYSVCVCVHL